MIKKRLKDCTLPVPVTDVGMMLGCAITSICPCESRHTGRRKHRHGSLVT
jgi:hypothetical protein